MTFHLLNINEEPTASLLLGQIKDRDGEMLTVLYDLQEDQFLKISPHIDELLAAVSRVLGTPQTTIVMAYHRLHYSGIWYTCKPMFEAHDGQSLDFIGFDADVVRVAARDTSAYSTIHVCIEGFSKETRKEAVFETLAQLWEASRGEDDFRIRVASWASAQTSKAPT